MPVHYARLALALVILALVLFAAALIVALGWHTGNFDALVAGGLFCWAASVLFAP